MSEDKYPYQPPSNPGGGPDWVILLCLVVLGLVMFLPALCGRS